MAQLPIVEYPDAVLRQQAVAVSSFDSTTAELSAALLDTLYSTSGIGLCAPQIGQSLQVLVMDLSDNHSQPEVLVNPTILKKAGMAIVTEACLSIPGVAAKVMRSGQVLVQAYDIHGEVFEREYADMKAVCLQHEIDHLQGKLFIDRISSLRRYRFRHALRALESQAMTKSIPTSAV